MNVQQLNDQLAQLLPGAQLHRQVLEYQQNIELQLLALTGELNLNSAQIGRFWQQLPYWAFAWAAGQGLAKYILANPQCVADKRVLDFGCGSGLVGIAAAKAGAQSVVCCDTDPFALRATQVNAQRNGVRIDTVTDWCNSFDTLLAADVLYDLTSTGDLAKKCQQIPQWLVAETQFQLPPWSNLTAISHTTASTLPTLDDFDQDLRVSIYQRNSSE